MNQLYTGLIAGSSFMSTNQQITAKQRLVFKTFQGPRKYLNLSGAQNDVIGKRIAFFAMKHFENLNFFLKGHWTIL